MKKVLSVITPVAITFSTVLVAMYAKEMIDKKMLKKDAPATSTKEATA